MNLPPSPRPADPQGDGSPGAWAEAALGRYLLDGAISLPQLVIRWPDLLANVSLMQEWSDTVGASLAPHAKTTMSPEIIAAQLRAGAWGMTVATARQARACHAMGVTRVLIANQVRWPADVADVVALMRDDESFEVYLTVDDEAAIDVIAEAASAASLPRPVRLLVELGMPGGRSGVRTVPELMRLAGAVVRRTPLVSLAGLEGYEGIAPGTTEEGRLAQADAYLARMYEAAAALRGMVDVEPIVTAGGSVYFDRVVALLGRGRLPGFRLVIRPGGYVTHDSALYARSSPFSAHGRLHSVGQLRAALELWGVVQSRPEAGLAILGFGHRDAPARIDLPLAMYRTSASSSVVAIEPPVFIRRMDDHHAYLDCGTSLELRTGDAVGCGISHPCEAFERWRRLLVVDERRTVIGSIRTQF